MRTRGVRTRSVFARSTWLKFALGSCANEIGVNVCIEFEPMKTKRQDRSHYEPFLLVRCGDYVTSLCAHHGQNIFCSSSRRQLNSSPVGEVKTFSRGGDEAEKCMRTKIKPA